MNALYTTSSPQPTKKCCVPQTVESKPSQPSTFQTNTNAITNANNTPQQSNTSLDIQITRSNPANVHPHIPPPTLSWKSSACGHLQQFTGMPVLNKAASPDPIVIGNSSEINPNIRDVVLGDGHCLFRALSKEVTGTQSNYNVLRHAVVLYLQTNPQLASYIFTGPDPSTPDSTRIQRYITSHGLLGSGWGSDVEIQAIGSVLDIDIYTFCTYGHSRVWERTYPFTHSAQSLHTPHALYLFHNIAQDHYDRVHSVHSPP